jgi:3D (Asp-Asp-Asp) domain-containing protein
MARPAGEAFLDRPISSHPIAARDTAPVCGPHDGSKAGFINDDDDESGKLPVRAKVKECCGYPVGRAQDYRLSFYWLAYEAEYANERYDTDIYTKEGFWIGRFPNAFVFELKLEGSGILRDGRVLNYDGECRYGVGTCFRALEPSEHPLGRGVQARPLQPFRSIAVDPRFIPIGSPVYVPELVGVVLPDGTRHDGCLRADDQGGAIKLHKLDFFVESYFNFKYVADQLWWRLKATPHLDEPRCEYLRLNHSRERENEYCDWQKIHSRSYSRALSAAKNARRHQVLAASVGWRKHGRGSGGGGGGGGGKRGGGRSGRRR